MVTHDNRILDVADRIINLVDGRLESDTSPNEFVQSHTIKGATDVNAQMFISRCLLCDGGVAYVGLATWLI